MPWFDKDNLRFPLVEETDADSPVSEELMSQFRENFESLVLLLLGHGDSGTLTSDPPNDTTGVLTDTAASFDNDEHNDRTILFIDGTAKGNYYPIYDTTSNTIVIDSTNMYAEGVRSGDAYLITYNLNTGVNSGHNHNGLNSETVVPASATLTAAMLKTSTGEVSTNDSASNLTLPGGTYGFYPQFKWSGSYDMSAALASQITNTAYVTNIYLSVSYAGEYAYAQQRYVTSSGEIHWLFILRDYATSKVLAQWQAPDHPCFGNGGKPLLVKYPFPDVFEENDGLYRWTRDPETGLITDQKQQVEIIAINPGLDDVAEIEKNRIVDDEEKPDLSWLESFDDLYEINESKSADWPDIPVSVGLPRVDDDGNIVDDYRFAPRYTHVESVKKTIVKPDLIEIAAINKRKAA